MLGLLGALWSASGYVGGFMRASNVIFETPEGRPIWKLRPLQLAVTFVMVVLAAIVAMSLVFTGPLVDAVAKPLGIGSTAVTIWNVAKWPVFILIVLGMISLLYYAAPNVKLRGLKSVLPGALLALVVWIVASVAFAFYVSRFGSYNNWETFPQFMDAAAARKPSLNLAFIAPLTPFRHYVMGEASMERAATPGGDGEDRRA